MWSSFNKKSVHPKAKLESIMSRYPCSLDSDVHVCCGSPELRAIIILEHGTEEACCLLDSSIGWGAEGGGCLFPIPLHAVKVTVYSLLINYS